MNRKSVMRAVAFVTAILFLNEAVSLVYENMTFPDPCQLAKQAKSRRLDSSSTATLPKIIHQVWKDENIPSGRFADSHAAWKRLYPEPEYKHILWTDESARALIEDHFTFFLETYDKYPTAIQRADAVRYFFLYKYGGVYADLDYEPLINFWDYLPSDRVSFVESPYAFNEYVQNSLMASPVGHPLWRTAFRVLLENANQNRDPLVSTGPAAMDATISRYSGAVNILPCQNYHRIPIFGDEFRSRPFPFQVGEVVRYYSRLSKTCGDWRARDDCQFGIHHNSATWFWGVNNKHRI